MSKPHRLNVLGDFYVEDGCCTLCGVPWALAPHLFEPADDGCYVKRQPKTEEELQKMLEVIRSQELHCVRYRGRDRAIVAALQASGEGDKCDHPSG